MASSIMPHDLRYSANMSSPAFALLRNRVPAQNPQYEGMSKQDAERERRRAALTQFWATHKHDLKSIRKWAEASGVGYNTLNEFVRNKKDKNMLADTYEKLAIGASKLLGREVTLAELLQDINPDQHSRAKRIIALLSLLPDHEQEAWEEMIERHVKLRDQP